MSQSEARRRRRMCVRLGHVPKTDGTGNRVYCWRCGALLIVLGDELDEAARVAKGDDE